MANISRSFTHKMAAKTSWHRYGSKLRHGHPAYLLSPPFVRLSVCPSQAGVVSKRLDESSWFLEWRPPSAYPTLSYKELWVSPKTKVLPSGTLSQTRDLEDFATASRSRCRQNSSSSSSTVELVDDTYTTVDKSRLFTTSRSTAM